MRVSIRCLLSAPTRWARALIVILIIVGGFTPGLGSAAMVVASWNTLHLGWGEKKQYDQMARVAEGFDLVALQEVMDGQALARLASRVSELSGEHWSYMASHEVGAGSYSEAYGFLWRDSAVEYTGGAALFLDNNDVFLREPYSARFLDRDDGTEIVLASIHIKYGDNISDRLPEIDALADYWKWLGSAYPAAPRVIAGDFNLASDHPGWKALESLGPVDSVNDGPTTLSAKPGLYANQYDHIWLDPQAIHITGSGKVTFPELLGISHERARSTVSDHAPVWIGLGGATPAFDAIESVGSRPAATVAKPSCIDLNTAPARRLDDLPQVGPARAEAIIAHRPWSSPSDLDAISGLGPSRVRNIIDSGLLCSG